MTNNELHASWSLPIIAFCAALGIVVLLLWPLSAPPYLDDGIRHLAMARFLLKEGIFFSGGWSAFFYQGYLSQHAVDPWWLSNVLLMPLAPLPTTLAIKIYIVVSIAVLMLSFTLILRHLNIGGVLGAILLLALPFGSSLFFLRLFLARPFTLITAICLLVYLSHIRRQPMTVFILMIVAVLLSQLFVFPLFIGLIGIVWLLKAGERQAARKMGIALMCGTLIGLVIHPQPIEYIQYLITVFLRIPFLKNIGLGSEMASGFGRLAIYFVLTGGLVLLHLAAWKDRRPLRGVIFAEALVILFGVAALIWVRATDLLWPFLVVAYAELLALQPSIVPTVRREFFSHFPRRLLPLLLPLLMVTSALSFGGHAYNLIVTNEDHVLSTYAPGLASIPTGARVLNVDWDFFPILVSIRPDLKYATGIDASFTHLTDPEARGLLAMLWSAPFYREKPLADAKKWTKELLEHFPSDYLVIDKGRHMPFIRLLRDVPELEEMPSAGKVGVYEVVR